MPLPSISSHQCLVMSCSFSTCSHCSFYQLNLFPSVGSSTWVQMVPQRDASRKAPPKPKGLVNSCRATLADPHRVKTSWDSPSTTLKWCCPPNAKTQFTGIQRAELGSSFAFFLSWLCLSAFGILVPWPGIEPMPSAVTMPSPNHWTPKEVPSFAFLLSAQLIHFLIFALSYILNKIVYQSMIETQRKLILFDFYLYSREKNQRLIIRKSELKAQTWQIFTMWSLLIIIIIVVAIEIIWLLLIIIIIYLRSTTYQIRY